MVETSKLVLEAFESGLTVDYVIARVDEIDPQLEPLCEKFGVDLYSLYADTYDKLADAHTPQPALAVVHAPSLAIDERFEASPSSFLVLVDVSDPGNVGTLIRTAEAAGCAGVVVTSETADVLSPKVVRSSAGSVLRVPVGEVSVDELPGVLAGLGAFSLATAMDGVPYSEVDIPADQSLAIILGSEAHGLDAELLSSASATVSIPMHGKVESLNVATAGAVLAFSLTRNPGVIRPK